MNDHRLALPNGFEIGNFRIEAVIGKKKGGVETPALACIPKSESGWRSRNSCLTASPQGRKLAPLKPHTFAYRERKTTNALSRKSQQHLIGRQTKSPRIPVQRKPHHHALFHRRQDTNPYLLLKTAKKQKLKWISLNLFNL